MNIKQVFSDIKARIIAIRLKRGSVVLLDGRLVEVFTIPSDVHDIPCTVCEYSDRCTGFFRQVCLEMTPDHENQYGLTSVMKHK